MTPKYERILVYASVRAFATHLLSANVLRQHYPVNGCSIWSGRKAAYRLKDNMHTISPRDRSRLGITMRGIIMQFGLFSHIPWPEVLMRARFGRFIEPVRANTAFRRFFAEHHFHALQARFVPVNLGPAHRSTIV